MVDWLSKSSASPCATRWMERLLPTAGRPGW